MPRITSPPGTPSTTSSPCRAEQLAVLVLDADAHDAAAAAEQAEARARMCEREVHERAGRRPRPPRNARQPKLAAEDRRFAVRWAHEAAKAADRAGDRAEAAWKLNEQVQAQLHTLGGELPATTTSRDSLDRAEQAQRRTQRLARQAWEATGAPMPQPISEQLSAPTPTARYGAAVPLPKSEPAAPGSPRTDDGPDAEVLPFPGTDDRGRRGRPAPVRTRSAPSTNGSTVKAFSRSGPATGCAPTSRS